MEGRKGRRKVIEKDGRKDGKKERRKEDRKEGRKGISRARFTNISVDPRSVIGSYKDINLRPWVNTNLSSLHLKSFPFPDRKVNRSH